MNTTNNLLKCNETVHLAAFIYSPNMAPPKAVPIVLVGSDIS